MSTMGNYFRRGPHYTWHKASDGWWKSALGSKEQGEFNRNLVRASAHFIDTEAI